MGEVRGEGMIPVQVFNLQVFFLESLDLIQQHPRNQEICPVIL